MDPAAVSEISRYLLEIHAKDPNFFKQLVTGARVSGRLFFDLKIDGKALDAQSDVTALMTGNTSVVAAKAESLGVVKAMQPTLNIDTVVSLQKFSLKNFEEVAKSDVWNVIVAGMNPSEVEQLQRILAGALTFKITSEAANPHLTDPAIRGNMKLFTAIVNMPHAPETILQMRTDEYKKVTITDSLSEAETNLITYIKANNTKQFNTTLNMLANTVSGMGSRLEFKYLGESGKVMLGMELGKLHSHLSNMDSKEALTADQSKLRDEALSKIEQIARDHNLSLSAPRPSLARGASSSPSSSPTSSRRNDEKYSYDRLSKRLPDKYSPRSPLASSTGAAAAAAASSSEPQQLQEERRPMERAKSPPPSMRRK